MAEHKFTDDNFDEEVLKSKVPVLVDFYADWCGPCRMMAPIVEELAAKYEGKWKVGKCNVDEAPNISTKYGIQSIPTILFFKDGQIVNMAVGFQSKENIEAKMG
jgi:thioredoxin 1